MTRGDQRERARAKNAKKEQGKSIKAANQTGNTGMSLEDRRHRDAEIMRQKQLKNAEKGANKNKPSGSGKTQ